MLYVNPLEAQRSSTLPLEQQKTQRTEKALQEYERLFLYQMLREMRKTVPENGLFGRSSQQEFFEEMFDDYLAGEMAESGQFGIAKMMEAQLEARQKTPGTLATTENKGLPIRNTAAAGLALQKNDSGLPLQSTGE